MNIIDGIAHLAEVLGVRLKLLDKKTERVMLHTHKKGLEEQLTVARDVPNALLIAVPYLIASTRAKVVAITGRSLETALDSCADLEPACSDIIRTAIKHVLEDLASNSQNNTHGEFDLDALKLAVLPKMTADE
jgi:preprotein translocase subunit Sec63